MGMIYISLVVLGITAFAFISKLAARKRVAALDLTFVLFFAAGILGYFWARAHHVPAGAYSPKLLLLAAVAGTGGTLAAFSFNHAVKIGHFGFSNAIYRSAFLIPVLFSVVAFEAKPEAPVIVGIFLILASIFLVSWSNESFGGEKRTFVWFMVIMLSFFSGGLPRSAQILVSRNHLSPAAYLFASYGAGFLILLVFHTVRGKFRISRWALLYGVLAAVASYVGVYSTIKALGTLPAAVVFPITLSAPILLGMLISFVSRERITATGWTGIVFGVAGILILALVAYA